MNWIKPSGMIIKTNDDKVTIAYCKSLGWKEEKEDKPKKSKKHDYRD